MKHPIRNLCKPIEYAILPFGYWIAPVLVYLMLLATAYCATHLTLPEKLQPYATFFLILGFLLTAFFLVIAVPCALYSGYRSVLTMVKERKYYLPGIQLALDLGLLVFWFLQLRKFIL